MEKIEDLQFGLIKFSFTFKEDVMISTAIGQLFSLPYQDSDAGSNPREFQGLSATNKAVLKSLICNFKTSFWARHSGISITVTKGLTHLDPSTFDGILEFEDACITNGLQSITLARILVMIKSFQIVSDKPEIHQKIIPKMQERFYETIRNVFPMDVAEQLLSDVRVEQVNSVLYWLHKTENTTYLEIVNNATLTDFLSTRVPFKAVILDELVTESPDETRESEIRGLGNEIAEANNETQNVKADDKFGTHHKEWLATKWFDLIPSKLIEVEYRKFAIPRGEGKVMHVLDLLRAILPTGLFIDQKFNVDGDIASFVAGYANHRGPIYTWYDKVIKQHQSETNPSLKNTIRVIRGLVPDLIDTMSMVQDALSKIKLELSFQTVNSWQPLKKTHLAPMVFTDEKMTQPKPDAEVNSILRKYLSFSFSNIFPIFVFATRSAIIVTDDFKISYQIDFNIVNNMVKNIYKRITKERLLRTLGSTSNLFRNPELYRDAQDMFEMMATTQQNDISLFQVVIT